MPPERASRPHALVTGAFGGLGTAIVRRLRRDGIPVLACDRREEDGAGWLEGFSPQDREGIRPLRLDVTREEEVESLSQSLASEGVEVAYLVNNAGVQGAAELWALGSRVWELVLRVNLHGTFYTTRAFSRPMAERGFGRIVNVASIYAYHPGPGQGAYAAAKAGVLGYTRSAARDLARYGITVNAIVPGLIWHERLRGVLPDRVYDELLRSVPLGRAGKPEEIAATVAFLLSEEAGYITGQTIHVNGGAYLPG